jgi:hypothetical protein
LKNFLLLILFFIIVGYAYVSVSERQKQRLIRERRPKIQEMVNKYEFRRALYQIRQTRKIKEDGQQTTEPEEVTPEEKAEDEKQREEVETFDRMKSEPSTPAQPIERPEERKTPADAGSELRRGVRSRYEGLPPGYDTGDSYQRPVQNVPEQTPPPQQPAQQQPQQPPQPPQPAGE